MVSAYDAFIRKSLVPESECKKMDKDQAMQKLKTEVKMLSKEELIALYEMSVIENASAAEEIGKLESELSQRKHDYSANTVHKTEVIVKLEKERDALKAEVERFKTENLRLIENVKQKEGPYFGPSF